MTKIEWTDETWNPTRGCSMAPGSELGGCLNCYAARNQLRRPNQTAASGKPFAVLRDSGPRWSGEVELIESRLTEPLHWRKSRRVFVNSMSDLWHEALLERDQARVYAVMAYCQWLTFQVLTKRPQIRYNYRGLEAQVRFHLQELLQAFGPPMHAKPFRWPLPNVWEGVSVEDQATADERIPKLLQTPAALRFVSYEPALGPVNFAPWLFPKEWGANLGWGIVGGESGPQARPCDLAWIESTVDQFQAAGVPLFVKQVGSRSGYQRMDSWHDRTNLGPKNAKGGDWEDWPEKIRVREFPR